MDCAQGAAHLKESTRGLLTRLPYPGAQPLSGDEPAPWPLSTCNPPPPARQIYSSTVLTLHFHAMDYDTTSADDDLGTVDKCG